MKYTERQIITAMKGTGGIVSQIIGNLAKLDDNVEKSAQGVISRQGLHDRIGKSETLKQAYVDEQEHIGDIAETGFFLALQDKEDWAIKEWFKYKGSTRGYMVKQQNEITGEIGVSLVEFIGDDNQDQNTSTEPVRAASCPAKFKPLFESCIRPEITLAIETTT